MGWDDQTFLSLGQSRTANGLAFDFTKPLSRWASPGLAVDRTTHPAGPIHAAGAIGAVWKVSADLV